MYLNNENEWVISSAILSIFFIFLLMNSCDPIERNLSSKIGSVMGYCKKYNISDENCTMALNMLKEEMEQNEK